MEGRCRIRDLRLSSAAWVALVHLRRLPDDRCTVLREFGPDVPNHAFERTLGCASRLSRSTGLLWPPLRRLRDGVVWCRLALKTHPLGCARRPRPVHSLDRAGFFTTARWHGPAQQKTPSGDSRTGKGLGVCFSRVDGLEQQVFSRQEVRTR